METTPKKGISTLAKVVIAAVFVLAAVLVQIFFVSGMGQRYMYMENTGHSVTYSFDASAMFHSNDSRFFYFATRNGIRMYPSNGNPPSWTHTFNFTRPMMTSAGDIVAMADYRGRRVYVFNASGHLFTADVGYPVLNFSVTDTGILTTIVSYDTGFGVHVYNQHRTSHPPLFYWSVHEYDGMYIPTMAEVSCDGRYIAVAMLDVNVMLNSYVLFSYVNQRDAPGTDNGLFGTERFTGQLITAMRFMDNNRLIVAATDEIRCFQVGPGRAFVREVWPMELSNRLSHIEFYGGSHFAFVTGEAIVGVEDPDPIGTVRIFSINGIESGVFHMGRRVTHFRMGQGSIIVGADRNFHAVDLRGSPLWEHTTLHDVHDFMFLDDTNTVLIARSNVAYVYRRRRIRDNGNDNDLQPIEQSEMTATQ